MFHLFQALVLTALLMLVGGGLLGALILMLNGDEDA